MRSISDVIAATRKQGPRLPAPPYTPHTYNIGGPDLAFMVASMKDHMTDEGYQLALALKAGGYWLCGEGFKSGTGNLPEVLNQLIPQTVVIQDKREWIGKTAGPGFDQREKFQNVEYLRACDGVFKLTVLKDAHADQEFHFNAAQEIGCHGWIIYYHPDLVAAQCPAVRKEHLVRTWHSLNRELVPPIRTLNRNPGVVSGAVSMAYPLRSRLMLEARGGHLRNIIPWRHPGYGRYQCCTPAYLQMLSHYRVSVCTSSRFGYAVRKIIESTACGCVVVTDLPHDEVLPEIDGNLIRVDSDISPGRVDALVGELAAAWDPDRQFEWTERAKRFYDYRALGVKLAADIETLRRSYNVSNA